MADRTKFTLQANLSSRARGERRAFRYSSSLVDNDAPDWITNDFCIETITVTGELAELVHGYMGDNGSQASTLVVFDWWINNPDENKRIKEIQIKATFKNETENSHYYPRVISMAPRGTYSMHEHGNVAFFDSSQTPAAVRSFGFMPDYEPTTSTDRQDFVKIMGFFSLGFKGSVDRPNAARWEVHENASTKSGLPSHFRTAVFLQRHGEHPFTAHFRVDMKVGMFNKWTKGMDEVAGWNPIDECVIFDPKQPLPPIPAKNMESRKDELLELCTSNPSIQTACVVPGAWL